MKKYQKPEIVEIGNIEEVTEVGNGNPQGNPPFSTHPGNGNPQGSPHQ